MTHYRLPDGRYRLPTREAIAVAEALLAPYPDEHGHYCKNIAVQTGLAEATVSPMLRNRFLFDGWIKRIGKHSSPRTGTATKSHRAPPRTYYRVTEIGLDELAKLARMEPNKR